MISKRIPQEIFKRNPSQTLSEISKRIPQAIFKRNPSQTLSGKKKKRGPAVRVLSAPSVRTSFVSRTANYHPYDQASINEVMVQSTRSLVP